MTFQKHGRSAATFASRSAAAEKKSSSTCGVGGRRKTVSEPQWIVEENEEEMEEVSFAPSAVSELRWALHMCDNN